MKKTLLAITLITLSGMQGCATVNADGEKQGGNKTAYWVIGGLVVAGAIVAASDSGSDEHCNWVYRENGQSRVCSN